MFQSSDAGAAASILQAVNKSYDPQFEAVRHMLFGNLSAVQATIKLLHKLNYAEPNDWSRPVATGQPNEVVVVLMRRVRVG
ncbi:MAG: hypothetical protein AAF722_22680 [Cyanobacteria bacterium P01_C01_bin.70]